MEQWVPIHGYEGLYELSSTGRVRSLARVVPKKGNGHGKTRRIDARILKPRRNREPAVSLAKDGRAVKFTMVRLMAEHFPLTPSQPDPIDGEEWHPIAGYLGLYEVSSEGRVRSLDRLLSLSARHKSRTLKGRVLKHIVISKGYVAVPLMKNGVRQLARVHRLVADAFIPNISDAPQVNHRDLDKTNNRVTNLEWCTNRENAYHSIRKGAHGKRLSMEQAQEIRLMSDRYSQEEIGQRFGVSQTTISRILRGETWTSI